MKERCCILVLCLRARTAPQRNPSRWKIKQGNKNGAAKTGLVFMCDALAEVHLAAATKLFDWICHYLQFVWDAMPSIHVFVSVQRRVLLVMWDCYLVRRNATRNVRMLVQVRQRRHHHFRVVVHVCFTCIVRMKSYQIVEHELVLMYFDIWRTVWTLG